MAKVKYMTIGLVFVMLFSIISGCSLSNYHATLYDSADGWIQEKFINANPLSFDGGKTYPIKRVFVVNDKAQYDRIFVQNIEELAVDFDTQMLIVYTFVDTTRKNRQLVDMNLKDGVLEITYKKEKPIKEYFAPVGDTCMPYLRWFVVKMDKLNSQAVVFNKK